MFLKKFKFGDQIIGEKCKTFFIAEIGINHEGNFKNCKRMILEAYKAGADAVKFQTYKTENFVAQNDKKRFKQLKKLN